MNQERKSACPVIQHTVILIEHVLWKETISGLANILSACSSIQYRDEALLTRFCQELSKPERIRQLSPAGVGVATLALCRLQFYDGKYFSEYLKESTRSRKINVTRPTTLIDLMFGAVRADVVHFAQFMEIIK